MGVSEPNVLLYNYSDVSERENEEQKKEGRGKPCRMCKLTPDLQKTDIGQIKQERFEKTTA